MMKLFFGCLLFVCCFSHKLQLKIHGLDPALLNASRAVAGVSQASPSMGAPKPSTMIPTGWRTGKLNVAKPTLSMSDLNSMNPDSLLSALVGYTGTSDPNTLLVLVKHLDDLIALTAEGENSTFKAEQEAAIAAASKADGVVNAKTTESEDITGSMNDLTNTYNGAKLAKEAELSTKNAEIAAAKVVLEARNGDVAFVEGEKLKRVNIRKQEVASLNLIKKMVIALIPPRDEELVLFRGLTSTSISEAGGLLKDGADGWTGAAYSTKNFNQGTSVCGFSFLVPKYPDTGVVGLTAYAEAGTNEVNGKEIDFAIYYHFNKNVYIMENGDNPKAVSTWDPETNDNIFGVRVNSDNKVEYMQGDKIIFTSGNPPSFPLAVDASLYSGSVNWSRWRSCDWS